MATTITNVTELQSMRGNLTEDYILGNNIDASASATWNPTADRGEWQASTDYYVHDYVLVSTYSPARTYICHTAHTSGVSFATTNWWLSYGTVPVYLGFEPIAQWSPDVFTGSLDGNSYTITDLYSDRPYYYAGLFVWCEGATISNLTLADVNIRGSNGVGLVDWCLPAAATTVENCHVTGTITSLKSLSIAAGLVGWVETGTIHNCSVDVTITAADSAGGLAFWVEQGTISNSEAKATITAGDDAGGLVFWMEQGVIAQCEAESNITATENAGGFGYYIGGDDVSVSDCFAKSTISATRAAGFVYGANGDPQTAFARCGAETEITATSVASGFIGDVAADVLIQECYATGSVSGETNVTGFASYLWGVTINDCYARVDAQGVAADYLAGFCGIAWWGTITDSYSEGLVSGTATKIGGFCAEIDASPPTYPVVITDCFWDTETSGQATSDGGTGKTTAQMTIKPTFFDASWDIDETTPDRNDGYPFLSWEIGEDVTVWLIYGTGIRSFTIPDILDHRGRAIKNARVQAFRVDTHEFVETEFTDEYGSATFDELPNDVDVVFYVTWGGNAHVLEV